MESGSLKRKTVDYILKCEEPTGEKVWNWLRTGDMTSVPGGVPAQGHQAGVQDPSDRGYRTTGPPVPSTYQGVPLEDITYTQDKRDTDPVIFNVTAVWAYPENGGSGSGVGVGEDPPTGTDSISYSFDVTAEDPTIYMPWDRIKAYPSDVIPIVPPIPIQPGINVQPDGEIKGVKPPPPHQIITISRTDDEAFFTHNYLRLVSYYAGFVNSAKFPSI